MAEHIEELLYKVIVLLFWRLPEQSPVIWVSRWAGLAVPLITYARVASARTLLSVGIPKSIIHIPWGPRCIFTQRDLSSPFFYSNIQYLAAGTQFAFPRLVPARRHLRPVAAAFQLAVLLSHLRKSLHNYIVSTIITIRLSVMILRSERTNDLKNQK